MARGSGACPRGAQSHPSRRSGPGLQTDKARADALAFAAEGDVEGLDRAELRLDRAALARADHGEALRLRRAAAPG